MRDVACRSCCVSAAARNTYLFTISTGLQSVEGAKRICYVLQAAREGRTTEEFMTFLGQSSLELVKSLTSKIDWVRPSPARLAICLCSILTSNSREADPALLAAVPTHCQVCLVNFAPPSTREMR